MTKVINCATTIGFVLLVWTAAAAAAAFVSVFFYAVCVELIAAGAWAIALGIIPVTGLALMALGLLLAVIKFGWDMVTDGQD